MRSHVYRISPDAGYQHQTGRGLLLPAYNYGQKSKAYGMRDQAISIPALSSIHPRLGSCVGFHWTSCCPGKAPRMLCRGLVPVYEIIKFKPVSTVFWAEMDVMIVWGLSILFM